jgi:MFS family permease
MPLGYQVIPGYLEASGLPRAWVAAAMTLGQASEIALLIALPRMIRRFGIKATLAIGIAAWLVRYLGLALRAPLGVAVAGMLLHGAGIACFTVAAQVFVDARAPGHLRATAQALMLTATSGVGFFLGSLLVGALTAGSHPRDVLVFVFPCIILGALLLYFLRGFRVPASGVPWAGAPNDEPLPRSASGRGPVARVGHLVTESADG